MSRLHGIRLLVGVMLALVALLFLASTAGAQGNPQPEPTLAPLPTQVPTSTPTPSGTPAATPTPTPSPTPQPEEDGGGWFERRFVGVITFFLGRITNPMQQLIGSEWTNESGFILHTGPQITYNNETILGFWGILRTIANLALVVIAMWGGFNIIVRDSIGAEYHGAMELLPRLILGAVMINTGPWFIKLLIDVNNALCFAVGQASPPGWDAAGEAQRTLMGLLLWLVLLALLLVFQLVMLFRLAMLNFLIVLAPLASLCWVLPQTQGYARSWMRNFVGTVFSQFLQVLALSLSVSLLGALKPMGSDQVLSEILVAIAMMFVVFKAPALLAHHDHGRWVGGFLGYAAARSVLSRTGRSGRLVQQRTGDTAHAGGHATQTYVWQRSARAQSTPGNAQHVGSFAQNVRSNGSSSPRQSGS
ncbi:MAG: type IV secretion system protein [Chloroflexota bacterium]|nr:type IV secretion system protein [Chloroflexota bacterium]